MAVQFREKALMAYETMPCSQKNKVSHVISQLRSNELQHLKYHQLKSQDLDTWVVKVDQNVRLLFAKNERDFLIIDIVDRHQGYDL